MIKQLPIETRETRDDLIGQVQKVESMVTASKEELNSLQKSLGEIPSSKLAKELKPTPDGWIIPERRLLCAPNGQVYDPKDGTFYDLDKLLKENRPESKETWKYFCKK